MASREELISQMAQIQQDFARFVRNVEQDDLVVAVNYARTMAGRMETVLSEIQKNLAADFFNNRAKTFKTDIALIQKFENTPPTRAEQMEIAAAVTHFSGSIRALDHMVKLIYPEDPFSFKPLIDKYGRQAIIGGIAALTIGLVLMLSSHIKKQRHGLMGHYFASRTLENMEHQRVDNVINFRWGHGGPFNGWRTDDFSVRWTGYVNIPFADKWTFETYTDDGVRLYIGKKLIINDWGIHSSMGDAGSVDLTEGYYPVTLEFFEGKGNATMQLFWRPSRQRKGRVIPTDRLVPSASLLDKNIPVIEDLDHPGAAAAPASDQENGNVSPDESASDDERADDMGEKDDGGQKDAGGSKPPAKKSR